MFLEENAAAVVLILVAVGHEGENASTTTAVNDNDDTKQINNSNSNVVAVRGVDGIVFFITIQQTVMMKLLMFSDVDE